MTNLIHDGSDEVLADLKKARHFLDLLIEAEEKGAKDAV